MALGTFFPIYVNTHAALTGLDLRWAELARTVGLNRRQFLRRIALPGAAPGFFTGLRLAVTVSWLVLVVSEQINANSGIGYLMEQARTFGQTDVIVVGLVVYGLLGLASRHPGTTPGEAGPAMAHDTRLTDPAPVPGPATTPVRPRLRPVAGAAARPAPRLRRRTVLDGVDLDVAKGEFTAPAGPLRLRQVHPAAGRRPPRRRGRGPGRGARAQRGGLPGRPAAALEPGAGERGARPARAPLRRARPRPGRARRGRPGRPGAGLARHLSGGEAQRAALARALVREPELLLLDEPFGALDALTRIRMHALLRDLCARHRPAVLLVTHDVDEALLLADRVLVLADGRFCLDLPLPGPAGPDRRRDPAFPAHRERLLRALGVPESDPGAEPGTDAPDRRPRPFGR